MNCSLPWTWEEEGKEDRRGQKAEKKKLNLWLILIYFPTKTSSQFHPVLQAKDKLT